MSGRVQSMREVLAGVVPDGDYAQVASASRLLIVIGILVANVIGASVVVVLLGVVLPIPESAQGQGLAGLGTGTTIGVAVYVVVALGVGAVVGLRRAQPVTDFFRDGREPTEQDRRAVLGLPLQLLVLQAVLWAIAVALFGVSAARSSALYGFEVAITVTLGGIPTSVLAYLLTQRLLRSGVAVVLARTPPRDREVPGVSARALLAWSLGVVPVGGVITLAGFAPAVGTDITVFARATGVLCGVSLIVGFLATRSVSRAVADPLQRLRSAFEQIQDGSFDVDVPIFDATEVGYATASFNRMSAGLRERERLRDLFGRQVGGDVARQALEEGVTLGGEEREAAALFVDVIGSTSFAAQRPPAEVVEALNAFFDVVVTTTQEHGGLVNKFIGDAALCVFGAPLARDDPAAAALAAARAMARGLRDGELDAGIGVAFGTVVAGNVGNAERYEYTVIGDPVNEAARITELAKQRDGRLLASWAAVEHAGGAEHGRWRQVDETTLRGRSEPTQLAEPSDEASRSGPG